jgi:GNAT superfamily N-acetyltransferase
MSESVVTIRPAKPEDIEAMAGLLKDLAEVDEDFRTEPSARSRGLSMMLEDHGGRELLVADERGRIVGLCSAQLVVSLAGGGPVAMVETLVVTKSGRGVGIGSSLLTAMQAWAKAHGALGMQMVVDGGNIPSLEFLMKNGWRRSERLRVSRVIS